VIAGSAPSNPSALRSSSATKRIDGAYRIVFSDIVVETLRQKVNLGSIRSGEEAAHPVALVDSLLD